MSENERRLAEDNVALVYFILRKYYPTYSRDEDMQQIGMIGLCQAASTWDSEKSTFSTYASKVIINEIRRELSRRKCQKRSQKAVSLNAIAHAEDGESGELMDSIVGESDVNYFDSTPFFEKLSPTQKRVLELHTKGLSRTAIGKELGVSQQAISKHFRKMSYIWRDTYEN
jgi:RNA polymerase sigma factor (sigma-70 family)